MAALTPSSGAAAPGDPDQDACPRAPPTPWHVLAGLATSGILAPHPDAIDTPVPR